MDMTQKHLSKKTSVILVTALLVGTAGLATAAATDAGDTILPMMKGQFSAYERGLSRHTFALAVHVGQFDGETKTPVEGATVELRKSSQVHHRPSRDGKSDISIHLVPAEPYATKQTDSDGRAVFELKPGDYTVTVKHGDLHEGAPYMFHEDTRVGVVFGPDDEASWFIGPRHEVADRGEPVPLFVQVGAMDETGRGPVANATVKVLKAVRGDDGEMTFETVAENKTGAQGGSGFHLLPGDYYLDITTPLGLTAERPLRLDGPTGRFVLFDAEGEAHFRELHRGDHFDRPHDQPTDREPEHTSRPTPTKDPSDSHKPPH